MRALTTIAAIALAACQAHDGATMSMTEASTESGPPPAYVMNAVNSPERAEDQRARDATRMPAEILAMSGVEPGDRVIEIAGFGQYYTTMLSDIVGEDGHIDVYDLPYTDRFAGEASRAFDAAHPNTTYHQENYDDVAWPSDVDVAFNVLYYHDLSLNDIDIAAMNQALYDALKPGGTYLVIDHKAADGSGREFTESLHRMDTALIPAEITAAGFELVAESDILSHPEDDRTLMVFDESIRGMTDRAVFVFRKPAM